jgi:glycosyltransferase involved in cell wall biosynthesis
VTIGWIGSPSTWPNVLPLLPLLTELARSHGVRVRVVGAGQAAARDRFDGLDLVDWSEAGEVGDVQAMDIGIMPLADQPFERGKSGYKLVQYLACGLPVVASPVGVNCEIVREDVGFLATTEDEWRAALTTLIADAELRRRLGSAGRAKAESAYSLASQTPRLVEVLRSAARLHRKA